MGCGEACPLVPGLRREDWPLKDPKGRPLEEVRSIRDELQDRIEALQARERWGRASASSTSTSRKEGVLFLCTANSARSQMAEVLLERLAGDRFEVHSAGLQPTRVHPLTHEVLRELGLDTSTLHSKSAKQFLAKFTVRYAIIVCEKAAKSCPQLYPFATETLYWPFEDPAAFVGSTREQLERFRFVRDQVDARIHAWLSELGAPMR
jgi:arsenate reductase